jgi:hypothetical protein
VKSAAGEKAGKRDITEVLARVGIRLVFGKGMQVALKAVFGFQGIYPRASRGKAAKGAKMKD